MDILTLLVVGLVAGLLASIAVGGVGYGILGDIVIGIIGAFLGSWLFSALRIRVPFSGIGGTIFVAFIGAVVLLLILRVLRRGRST
ncbi:MAG TPA: GlsB/YeaQ/YmgE family stress response membrane protein [Gemmatimonadales bacterium]